MLQIVAAPIWGERQAQAINQGLLYFLLKVVLPHDLGLHFQVNGFVYRPMKGPRLFRAVGCASRSLGGSLGDLEVTPGCDASGCPARMCCWDLLEKRMGARATRKCIAGNRSCFFEERRFVLFLMAFRPCRVQ